MKLVSLALVTLVATFATTSISAQATVISTKVGTNNQLISQAEYVPSIQRAVENCTRVNCLQRGWDSYRTNYSKYRAWEYEQFRRGANEIREEQRKQQFMRNYCRENYCRY
jgi:cyclopropane fatty-acyl-phospholipid synthase-like methyltransferase